MTVGLSEKQNKIEEGSVYLDSMAVEDSEDNDNEKNEKEGLVYLDAVLEAVYKITTTITITFD